MSATQPRAAVCLVSGGLDSATAAAVAREEGFDIFALSFDYGQRHRKELDAAARVATALGAKRQVTVRFNLREWGGSSLTDDIDVPLRRSEQEIGEDVPPTYVPARNTIFLSFALGWAETLGCRHIFIGVNQLDYSGYPDCRAEFLRAFERTANLGTRTGIGGTSYSIEAPLLAMSKAEIIRLGSRLGVDYSLTWSCYLGEEIPCGACDSCILRAKGFQEAGMADPLVR